MKKVSKRITAGILALAMCLSLAACTDKPKDSNTSPSPSASPGASPSASPSASPAADDFSEHMDISIALWGIGDAFPDGAEDRVRDDLFKKFNITIKPYAVTWGDYTEKILTWAATKKLPDVTATDVEFTDNFNKWVKEGVIRAIPEDMSAYPIIDKLLKDPQSLEYRYQDGKYYSIPRPNWTSPEMGIITDGIALRKDWMAKVGMPDAPKTTDELIALLKAFQEKDPDGNGKKDTIGLTAYNSGYFYYLHNGYNVAAYGDWVADDTDPNKWIPSFMHKDFLEGTKVAKQFFDAGVIDPDYAILKGEEGRDKFKTGKAGAYAHNGPDPGGIGNAYAGLQKTLNNAELPIADIIEFVPMFPDYETGLLTYRPGSMFYSASVLAGGVDDKKANRFFSLLEYTLSQEGYEALTFGFEGEDYTKNADGTFDIKPLAAGKTIFDKYPSARFNGIAAWSSYRVLTNPSNGFNLRQTVDNAMKILEEQKAKGAVPADIKSIKTLTFESKSLETASSNYQKDFIRLMGAKDVEAEWKTLCAEYMKNGYDKVIAEVNAAADAAGLKK